MRIFLQSFQEVYDKVSPPSILSFDHHHPKRERTTGSLQSCWRSRKNCGFARISNASLRAFAYSSTTTTTTQSPPKLPAGVSLQLPVLPLPLPLIISRFPCLRLGSIVVDRKGASHIRSFCLQYHFASDSGSLAHPFRAGHHREEVYREKAAIRIEYPRSRVRIRHITFPRWVFPPRLGWLGGSPFATSSPVPSSLLRLSSRSAVPVGSKRGTGSSHTETTTVTDPVPTGASSPCRWK